MRASRRTARIVVIVFPTVPSEYGGEDDEIVTVSGENTYIAMSNTHTANVVEATLMITMAIMLSQMPPLTMLPMLT